ncbi:MAG: lipopolysaccharide heptosyltransferase I [Candidatus Berkiella sp.]
MKKVLIIKMSSMGDVIHTLPALTDALNADPSIQFDWVVEPGFAQIPTWHKAVRNVIHAPLRRLRKSPWQAIVKGEWQDFIKALRQNRYDLIIDAQGLLKSALVAWGAQGTCAGLHFKSAREKLASLFYRQRIVVPWQQHAVERVRQLFAGALNYPLPTTPPQYGIDTTRLPTLTYGSNTIIFLHGTTWPTKHWPQSFWEQLAYLVGMSGFQVLLPWGNEIEQARAKAILRYCENNSVSMLPIVLPKHTLAELTTLLSHANGVVAVDTGLGHMAAAMASPTVSLYGPTSAQLTGAYGPWQHHIKSTLDCSPCLKRECRLGEEFKVTPPCFESMTPRSVWQDLQKLMKDYQKQHVKS